MVLNRSSKPLVFLRAYLRAEHLTESTESSVISTPRSGTPSSQVSNLQIPDNTVMCSVQSRLSIQNLRRGRNRKRVTVGTMTMHNKIEIKATMHRHSDGDIMIKIDPKIPFQYRKFKKLLTTPYDILVNVREINEEKTDILSEEIARQFILQESTLDYKLLSKQKWLEQSECSKIDISIKVIFRKLYAEESRDDKDFMMVYSAAG